MLPFYEGNSAIGYPVRFDNFQVGKIDDFVVHLSGETTCEENIADNVAAKVAFRAFRRSLGPEKRLPGLEKYSGEQVYFMAYAQVAKKIYKNFPALL